MSILNLFDSLTDREFAFLASLIRPADLSRAQWLALDTEPIIRAECRRQLAGGQLDADVFAANVAMMRAVAPRAWGLQVVR